MRKGDQLRATCLDVRHDILKGNYTLEGLPVHVEWRRWQMSALLWSHISALYFLQGATLQSLIEPFFLLAGSPRPVYAPEPGMDRVVLAEIYAAPPDVDYAQLFSLLAPEARA